LSTVLSLVEVEIRGETGNYQDAFYRYSVYPPPPPPKTMDVLEWFSTIKRDARREEHNIQMDMECIEVEKVVKNPQKTEVIQGFIGSHGKPATTTIIIW
jgi:hypothetical protein